MAVRAGEQSGMCKADFVSAAEVDFKKVLWALIALAQWIERQPRTKGSPGLIPVKGTCPDFGLDFQ